MKTFGNKESTFSRISLYFNLLLGLCLILTFFLIIRLKSIKFVPGSMQNISYMFHYRNLLPSILKLKNYLFYYNFFEIFFEITLV